MKKVLLIGNDINNITNKTSWDELLNEIIKIGGNKIEMSRDKPFPLIYEEIYLKALKSKRLKEQVLKQKIATIIDRIEPNQIHQKLIDLDVDEYLTTNYDFVLEKVMLESKSTSELKNQGIIKETKYNVFRHNKVGEKRFWHIHGDINISQSITLGFEHYGGQLQQLRNYTVTGTNYKNRKGLSLYRRLTNKKVYYDSWIDFFFTAEIHILGLKLGYEETDLWWLITNRARYTLARKRKFTSRIKYYCPKIYADLDKFALMEANEIEVVVIDAEGEEFYNLAIERIKS